MIFCKFQWKLCASLLPNSSYDRRNVRLYLFNILNVFVCHFQSGCNRYLWLISAYSIPAKWYELDVIWICKMGFFVISKFFESMRNTEISLSCVDIVRFIGILYWESDFNESLTFILWLPRHIGKMLIFLDIIKIYLVQFRTIWFNIIRLKYLYLTLSFYRAFYIWRTYMILWIIAIENHKIISVAKVRLSIWAARRKQCLHVGHTPNTFIYLLFLMLSVCGENTWSWLEYKQQTSPTLHSTL